MEHLLTGTVASVASVILASWLARTIYNIYFHPLAGFPGPWWVGGSYLAEFYYDVVQGGLYFKKIEELHETYGKWPTTYSGSCNATTSNNEQALLSASTPTSYI